MAWPDCGSGYGICSDTELIRRMEQVTQLDVSVPAQAAGIAAAREQEFVAVSRQMITEQKKLLLAGLEAAGAKVLIGSAQTIFFSGQHRDLIHGCIVPDYGTQLWQL